VLREITRPFEAWDQVACHAAMLVPGLVLDTCRIQRFDEPSGREAYGVEFHLAGRQYTCPLYLFQARTRIVELDALEGIPARDAATVR
jgi:hypothetical protein